MILKKYLLPIVTVISLALIDNLTKYYVRVENIQELVIIENFLTIDLTYNTGIAFGFLSDYTNTTYTVSLLVLIWLVFQIKDSQGSSIELYSFTLILGGAVGNLSERGWNLITDNGGKVTDFIELLFIPSFNFADSLISIGISLLLFSEFKNR
ncbi:signal peptidase II [Candidatus Actinomarina]|nr:signal peptidase II [Candidatus Actinomarina sp.]